MYLCDEAVCFASIYVYWPVIDLVSERSWRSLIQHYGAVSLENGMLDRCMTRQWIHWKYLDVKIRKWGYITRIAINWQTGGVYRGLVVKNQYSPNTQSCWCLSLSMNVCKSDRVIYKNSEINIQELTPQAFNIIFSYWTSKKKKNNNLRIFKILFRGGGSHWCLRVSLLNFHQYVLKVSL